MDTLPAAIIAILSPFASAFSPRVWESARVMVVGAILAPGQRTVTAILRVLGLSDEPRFQLYHRVLNRAHWSSRALSHILLLLVLAVFVPDDQPLVVGLDETIERRRGAKIAAKGIYRDPVRSSKSHFVKTSGLRWLAMMALVPIPWAQRVWALPFLTVLAPSQRSATEQRRRHKTLPVWGRQMIRQLRRWLPNRTLVVVADSSYAVLELLACAAGLHQPVTVVTRLRLDAALYDPPPPREAGTKGRPRLKGARQPKLAQRLLDAATVWTAISVPWYGGQTADVEVVTGTALWYHAGQPLVALRWVLLRSPSGQFESQALLCTDLTATPEQIIGWFVLRWQLEVTFHEGRTHLGVETQRQWSDLAILRTTPALFGLFSLVTLMADALLGGKPMVVREAAWYTKPLPTFVDALAMVRQQLWPCPLFSTSEQSPDLVTIPCSLLDRFTDTLAYTA